MEIAAEEAGLIGPLLLARSTVDRSALLRGDTEWLARAWADPSTRVLVVDDARALVRRGAAGAELVLLPPDRAPEGERYLLGVDDAGVAYFAVAAPLPDPAGLPGRPDAEPANLRQAGAQLDDRDAGLLVYAVALEAWHSTHTHCPRCGTETLVTAGGHMRLCPRDESQHFPRVDPAVIMLVHDGADRCLLARNPSWPERRFSVLAGFVEPGESLEGAVRREVAEEVGIDVTDTRYLGSQPWPFPRSLMLGFFARAVSYDIRMDAEEIAEARWLTREELALAATTGEIMLPSEVSIARRLIETWYGGPLPGSW
ncbi:NAD(+) diphosphatase [Bailinhaonella thermotolerans]|uniref:NAD(+) diphosphatase n=1 Tax=Bailinhaonella thermotolerans TaxID=1070861 RepID=A0A3A4B594_9ACTN|nr:NAD(+) diphosphatase [Bailinhaonella thermotolerans]RJL33507.1 NAD(+) diphosphatase [Bailinhaonella thermotolerans]